MNVEGRICNGTLFPSLKIGDTVEELFLNTFLFHVEKWCGQREGFDYIIQDFYPTPWRGNVNSVWAEHTMFNSAAIAST